MQHTVNPHRPTAGHDRGVMHASLLPHPLTRPTSSTYTFLHPTNATPPESSFSSSSTAPLQHCKGFFCHPTATQSPPQGAASPVCHKAPGLAPYSEPRGSAPLPSLPAPTVPTQHSLHLRAVPPASTTQSPTPRSATPQGSGQRRQCPKPAWPLCRMRPTRAIAHSSPAHQRSTL